MPTPLPTLPPPLRRVRLLPNPKNDIGFTRFWMTPHILIGIGSLVYSLFLLLASLCAAEIPATALSVYMEHQGAHISYNLRFTYFARGQLITSHETVTVSDYSHFDTLLQRPHQPQDAEFPLYYFSLGPLTHASISTAWSSFVLVALWTLFWNFVMSLFVWQFWLLPLRRRWLCRYGLPTPGTLLSKTAARKLTYVTYSYQDSSGQHYKKKMLVPRLEDWQSVTPGDTRTVLHHPTKPRISTLYELSGYEILPDTFTIKDDPDNPYAAPQPPQSRERE